MQLSLLLILSLFSIAVSANDLVTTDNGYLPKLKPITNQDSSAKEAKLATPNINNAYPAGANLIVRDPFAATSLMVQSTQSSTSPLVLPNIRLKAIGLQAREKVAILEIDGFSSYLVVKPNQSIDLPTTNGMQPIKILSISTEGVEVSTGTRKVIIR